MLPGTLRLLGIQSAANSFITSCVRIATLLIRHRIERASLEYAEYAAYTDQIAVFKRSDFKDQVDNGETLDPPTSELKLMREYQSTESDPFAADVIHRWTVPQRSPDLR